MTNKPPVIDAFLFNDELDILEFRLKLLWPLVDKFVIVEADHTFSGDKKPFHLSRDQERFAWAQDKIISHEARINPNMLAKRVAQPASYDPEHPCWDIEKMQRDSITAATQYLPNESLILMGDVDEIPSREALAYAISDCSNSAAPVVFRQSMFYYNLKFMRKEIWNGTVWTDIMTLRDLGPQKLRECRKGLPGVIMQGGWHLSHFGTADRIRDKIQSSSHQELNKDEFKDRSHIAYCIETGEDLYDRDVPIMPVTSEMFPDYFKEHAPAQWWG